MIHFFLLISRQGKVRLAKWYTPTPQKDRSRDAREVTSLVLHRAPKLCNVLEWREQKLIYKRYGPTISRRMPIRYASLYFVCCVDSTDNELIVLETIHHFVEMLDRYFGNVCELDLIFNFHKAYYILDEVLIGGELQETSKRSILKLVAAQDQLMQEAESGKK